MRQLLVVWMSVLVAFSGCASHTPSSMPVPKAGAMLAWRTEGSVAIGADPYVEKDRQKAIFDGDLAAAGVLPILVLIRNEGSRVRFVRASTITLTLPDGGELGPVGTTAVVAKMESAAGVIGSTIAFGIIGALVAGGAQDKARASRLADYQSKQLQTVKLRKGESTHGFVYFIPPPGTAFFTEATLAVKVVDVEDFASFAVRLPLSGLDFKEVPVEPEQGPTSTVTDEQ